MHPINQAVQHALDMMNECGITESPVLLTPDYDLPRCAYERGVPIQVIFGGRSAVFVAEEPVQVTTKPSFMVEAPLKKPVQRSAAAGILNAVAGFLCISRRLHACTPEDHASCRNRLSDHIRGKRIYCLGEMADIKRLAAGHLVDSPDNADLVIITGDGLTGKESEIIEDYPAEKLLFIGPSTSGTANFLSCQHFCPFGRANLQTSED